MGLTAKQRVFVQEYLIDLCATRAAIREGYSPKRADAIGHENLRKPEIKAAIQRAMDERATRIEVTQDQVLTEIARVAFSDIRRLFDGNRLRNVDELDDTAAAAIASIKVVTRNLGEGEIEHVHEIKLWPKTAALEMAAKHIGLFERDNRQKNQDDPVAAILAEIQANSKRCLPCEDKRTADGPPFLADKEKAAA